MFFFLENRNKLVAEMFWCRENDDIVTAMGYVFIIYIILYMCLLLFTRKELVNCTKLCVHSRIHYYTIAN